MAKDARVDADGGTCCRHLPIACGRMATDREEHFDAAASGQRRKHLSYILTQRAQLGLHATNTVSSQFYESSGNSAGVPKTLSIRKFD
jgi:hypothetical protein